MSKYPISALLKSLPSVSFPRLIHSGLALWVVWDQKVNASYYQTLARFGGLKVVEGSNQSLWFFQNPQVFPALARLLIWSQIHPESVIVQVFPVKLIMGENIKETSLALLSPLDEQKMGPGQNLEVWVHPDLAKQVAAFPGLSVHDHPGPYGMSSLSWRLFKADPNFSLDAELGWIFFVKPMRDSSNETFIQRWKNLHLNLKSVLDRMGLRYFYQEGLLFFKIEGLSLLTTWLRELLKIIDNAKSGNAQAYWPCLFMGINQKGLTFTEDLPHKVNLPWDRLPPDMPLIPLGAALLLRDEFSVAHLDSSWETTLDTPCLISLAGEGETEQQALVFPASKWLSSGNRPPCFYCGLKNHSLVQCPSRNVFNWDPVIWEKVAKLDFKNMTQDVQALDKNMEGRDIAETANLLQAEAPENIIVRAVFEISAPVQHRMMRLVWRSRGKEMPDGLRQLASQEEDFIWAALENLRSGNAAQAERMMQQALLRAAKSYQPHVLLGFIALENDSTRKAEAHWNEALRLCYTPLQQSYLLFLKARLKEIHDAHDQAHGLYCDAQSACPKWLEPGYRQAACMVKKGFLDQAWSILSQLISKDPNFFNRLLLDVELHRGRTFLLSSLAGPWNVARSSSRKARGMVEKMNEKLEIWFDPDDTFSRNIRERLDSIIEQMQVDNHVPQARIETRVHSLNEEMDQKIEEAVESVKSGVRICIEQLRLIMKELEGFPFQRIIRRIAAETNQCARILQSIKATDLHVGEKHRRARMELEEAKTILGRLKKRLRSIKIMRDGSLFFLFLGKNFLWLTVVGMIASIVLVPVLLHGLQKADVSWAAEWTTTQRWQVQRAVSAIMVIVCATLATVWTSLRFEKQKRKYMALVRSRKTGGGKR